MASPPAEGRLKRGLDIVVGLALLAPALLVVLPAMAAIRLGSPGPALFRQRRIGRREQVFILYKLRTMYVETADVPSHYATAGQVTPLGRWLRKWKVDELPQLINVLRGDMSLVGPRPCLPSQSELIGARRARGVFAVRPGITGLAQLQGVDMSDPERLAAVDGEYLERAGLLSDIAMLWRTLAGSGSGDAIR